MATQRTSEQPHRGIVDRYTDHRGQWVELTCGHHEPAADLPDTASSVRCRECLPVRVAPPAEVRQPWQ